MLQRRAARMHGIFSFLRDCRASIDRMHTYSRHRGNVALRSSCIACLLQRRRSTTSTFLQTLTSDIVVVTRKLDSNPVMLPLTS